MRWLALVLLTACSFPFDGSDLHGKPTPPVSGVCRATRMHILSFKPSSATTVSTGNGALAAGRFHGAHLDVAVIGSDDNLLYIVPGNGDGTLGGAASYPTQKNPSALTIEDFDGDGHLDVAVVNHDSNSLSVFFNAGDGTFPMRTDIQTRSAPARVIAGDVNGDGAPDLLVASGTDNLIALHLNQRSGRAAFAAPTSTLPFPSGGTIGLALGDLNGDAALDVAACSFGGGGFSFFLNSAGSFPSRSDVPDPQDNIRSNNLVVGDLTGDGVADVLVENAQGATLSLFVNSGKGSFPRPPTFYTSGAGLSDLAICDFNGDGKQDIATVGTDSYSFEVLLGNAGGTLDPPLSTKVIGDKPVAFVTGDFDGDDQPDLAVWNTAGELRVMLNQSN